MSLVKKNLRAKKHHELLCQLLSLSEQGVVISIGKRKLCSPFEAADIITVNEQNNYMPDYLLDNTDKLAEVHYAIIKNY